MRQLLLKPEIHRFETCKAFAEQFQIGKGDLVLSNEFIYMPYFGALSLECDVLYQEKYGAGEPSDEMAEAIYKDINGDYKRIIAIGGGTVIDLAKLYCLKNVSPILDLYDGKMPVVKDKQLILVPTTCGTGSEVTNITILEIKSRHTKMGLANDALFADAAVMVPELLNGLPYQFFATSSIDALIHAVESSVSPKATMYTKLFGYKAIEMIINGFMEMAEKGKDARLDRLGEFLIASNYAGIAFGNAGVGAVHAMSYPFGGKYHVAHGESNYVLFTTIFKHYLAIQSTGAIDELTDFMKNLLGCGKHEVFEKLEQLLSKILTRKPLREYGVTEQDLVEFTENVVQKQTRLTVNNFVPLDAKQVLQIYKELY